MAIPNVDGGIVLSVSVDTSAVEQGLNRIKNAANKIGDTKGIEKLQREFDKVTEKIRSAEAEMAQIYARLDQLAAESFKAPGTGEPIFVGNDKAEVEKLNARLVELQENLDVSRDRASELSGQIQNIGNGTEKLGKKASEAEGALQMPSVPAALDNIGKSIEKTGRKITGLIKRVFLFSVITSFLRSVRENISNVLMSNEDFRNSLYRLQAALWTAFQPILEYIVPAIKTLVNWLTVAVTTIGQFIAAISGRSYAAMADAAKATKEQADAYKNASKNASGAAKSMKKVTDEAKKQLAAFDELNILTNQTDEDTGGGGGGGSATPDIFGQGNGYDASDIENTLAHIMEIVGGALLALGLILLFTGNIGWGIGAIIAGLAVFGVAEKALGRFGSEDIEVTLARLGEIVGAFLFVLGVILLMFGNYPLGIGAIVVGAAAFGVSEAILSKNGVTTEISNFFKNNESLLVGASIAALLLGILIVSLAGPTFLPLGIGLIVAGAGIIAAEIALNDGAIGEKISKFFDENMALLLGIAGMLIVLGIILCSSGQLVWGISMLVAGAGVIVAEVALHWDAIKTEISKFFDENSGLIVGVSIALLVLGIILIVTGVGLPLGIGLILFGAAGLVAEVVLNWEAIKEKVSELWNSILDFMQGWGALILGIILSVTGVGLPIGIALILQGAGYLTAAQNPTWLAILDKIKEVWGAISQWWKDKVAPIFTAGWWLQLAKNAGNGLINGFEKAINGVISIFEKMINWIVDGINSIGFDLPDLLGGGHIGFNIPRVSFGRVSIPRLAQGAVIPPNSEFLAVLGDQKSGTNVEAPLETIKQALMEALRENNGYGRGSSTVILEVNGREFGRAVVELGDTETRRIGTRLAVG